MFRPPLFAASLLCALVGPALTMAEARMLSGSLTYRERIALPEGAEWRIEITGAEGEIATHAAP
ncbi:MAG: hypothetical protein ACK4GW_03035, partial [Pseudorhodobacter sp.]